MRYSAIHSGKDGLAIRPFHCPSGASGLMLADHAYSSGNAAEVARQGVIGPMPIPTAKPAGSNGRLMSTISAWAITPICCQSLPKLRPYLPAITRHKGFKQRSQQSAFRWQDKAFDLAGMLATTAPRQQKGFFGVNMASTGCGKPSPMPASCTGWPMKKLAAVLAVALGLRTLTLQTGDALGSIVTRFR